METTKKVWCVTNGLTDSVNLFENRNTAKRFFAKLVKQVKQNGGNILMATSMKDDLIYEHDYFSIFIETEKRKFHWIRCQEKTISQL